MLEENDRRYLFRNLDQNNCILFLGAGFSADAVNELGQPLPQAGDLSRILWEWQGISEPYDREPLHEVYQAALQSGKPHAALRDLLQQHLTAVEVAAWYGIIPKIFWYRIYGTNVDNVVEVAFREHQNPDGVYLQVIPATIMDYRDRDQFIARFQYVKLNGSLPGRPDEITFSTRSYARRSAEFDIWYDHFVRDYIFQPTIFVGTQLREPLFWQAVEARDRRGRHPEERAKSFLVSPQISPTQDPILRDLNIVHVPATGSEFFEWLDRHYSFPNRTQVLSAVAPDLVEILAAVAEDVDRDLLTSFLEVFPRVPLVQPRGDQPKTFFLGAPPTWADLAEDFDAPRDLTTKLLEDTSERLGQAEASFAVLGVLGAGGAGKSTILKRLALSLRSAGRQVFFSEGYNRPNARQVAEALDLFEEQAVLIIDNSHLLGSVFAILLRQVRRCRRPPIVIFGSRYNLIERYAASLVENPAVTIYHVPDLSEREIHAIIEKLDINRQLGQLEGKSPDARYREFSIRARKQILVAMREATEGRGFDDIIRSEYADIDNEEADILFLCAALASAENIHLCRKQWIACASVKPTQALELLNTNLRGLLIPDRERDTISARHAIIAEYIVAEVAPRQRLAAAYQRVLSAISHDIYRGRGRQRRSWRLSVKLINHKRIYERFTEDIDHARQIYESIGDWFRKDGHYWLQYTNLEIEYGRLELARPLLAHAESLMPESDLVYTTRAHLLLREARVAVSLQEARERRREAEAILFDQIERRGGRDEYPYHVYLTQMHHWLESWGWKIDRDELREKWEDIDEIAAAAREAHPYSRKLRQIAEQVRHRYLQFAVRE